MTELDICNRALSRLGTRATISALDENSTEARTVSIWYVATRDTLLRAHDWNFARRRQMLGRASAVSDGWAAAYVLPFDCVRLLSIEAEDGGKPPFEVVSSGGSRQVLCDDYTVFATFTARVADVAAMPPAFQAALVDQLAAHVAYPITQKTGVAVRLAQLARASLADAMTSEGASEGPPSDAVASTTTERRRDALDDGDDQDLEAWLNDRP